MSISDDLIAAAKRLSAGVDKLKFASPVTHVYNPLEYAWRAHQTYLKRFANGAKRVLFLGMNPGPFGMAQTGVPFGQIVAVRDWLGVAAKIDRPKREHPNRPVLGFDCHRNEVSGERLWGLFARRFETPNRFFQEHLVVNYCPLAFMEESGRNLTPDKLRPAERKLLFALCDEHLGSFVRLLNPEWIIGVGDFAAKRARESLGDNSHVRIGRILHPSPASPASNKDWGGKVTAQLRELGVWDD